MSYRMVLYSMDKQAVDDMLSTCPAASYDEFLRSSIMNVAKYPQDATNHLAGLKKVIATSEYPTLAEFIQTTEDYDTILFDKTKFKEILEGLRSKLDSTSVLKLLNASEYEIKKILDQKDLYNNMCNIHIDWATDLIVYSYQH